MNKPSSGARIPAHRPAQRPRPAIVRSASPAVAPSSPAVPVRPAARVSARPVVTDEGISGYVALPNRSEAQEFEPRTNFLKSIANVQAMTVREPVRALVPRRSGQSLAQLRGYDRQDLLGIAEIAYHYLMNGAPRIALTLFEGLQAVSPREAYFALALGLTHDHLGEKAEALRWYQIAAELDPTEPRADLNRAELYIEVRDRRSAVPLLEQARDKAQRRREPDLARKAAALIDHLHATL